MKEVTDKIALFFAEFGIRWRSKSPKYMRIWRTINLVLVGVGGIPTALINAEAFKSPLWAQIILWVITFCGAYGAAMNRMVVSNPTTLPLTEKIQEENRLYFKTYEDLPAEGSDKKEYIINGFVYVWQVKEKVYILKSFIKQ